MRERRSRRILLTILHCAPREAGPMAKSASLRTEISTKGQVPKAIRDRRGWAAGVELIVEERPEGVLLRAAPKTEATRFEDVPAPSVRSIGWCRSRRCIKPCSRARGGIARRSMISIDTNVIVRYLVADDTEQFRTRDGAHRGRPVFVRIDRRPRGRVGACARSIASIDPRSWPLAQFAALPTVAVEDRASCPRRSTGPNRAWTSPTRSTSRARSNAKPSRASIAACEAAAKSERWRCGAP